MASVRPQMPPEETRARPDVHRAKPRRRVSRTAAFAVALTTGVVVTALVAEGPDTRPPRPPGSTSELPPAALQPAFHPDSWWNTPLPDRTPLHPDGTDILRYIRTAPDSGRGCLMLAGAGDSRWGTPLYWTKTSDPTYNVTGVVRRRPEELSSLRIPVGARPAANSDGSMSIYDLDKGYVVALTGAEYDEDSDTWSAAGATVTYLDSNGLHVDTGQSDDPRNTGTHRGNNGATMAVSWDQVQEGAVRHVLKVALGPEVANRYVFPMVGSDGDYEGDRDAVPPQGLRLRIKASVELEELDLQPEALVIARALQRYGFYIGDSGGTTALKLENTRAEGRGQRWTLPADALCGLPFTPDYWEVVSEGYDPTR
jgi:hypothetical protein